MGPPGPCNDPGEVMMKPRSPAARRRVPLLACLFLVLPAALGAQDPLGKPVPRERAEELRLRADALRESADALREGAEGLRTRVYAMVQSRARLGVALGEPRQVGDRTGVAVSQVVDGGPAARAGIRQGDVLLALDGQPLGEEPGGRLVALMGDVEPGDTVAVLLHRDGRDHTLQVVTDRASPMTIRFGERGIPGVLHPGFDPGPIIAEALGERGLRAVGPLRRHELEMVAVNPELGRYFGVTEGVLVANIAAESTLGLRPGDVLISIGGRSVRDAAHARSILASYRADEEVEMQVVRDRRTITVRGTTGSGARP
jgi:S1-C subfamily serine protease